uniref:Uncharacterized protein n=1 Tax=Schistocephalus solidus TaxID=70667 RepID=A0A0X3PNW3_SCHSO
MNCRKKETMEIYFYASRFNPNDVRFNGPGSVLKLFEVRKEVYGMTGLAIVHAGALLADIMNIVQQCVWGFRVHRIGSNGGGWLYVSLAGLVIRFAYCIGNFAESVVPFEPAKD